MALRLASASPRRRELLASAGVAFVVDPADVDETPPPGAAGADVALALARRKALVVRERHPKDTVLAADTVVLAADGTLLGKPLDAADARRMLRLLSGSTQRVVTGVALLSERGEHAFAVTTEVTMRPLSAAEIDAYVATGEPFDKAGGYAIQETAEHFVTRIDGSRSNVVGLPLDEVLAALAQWGFVAGETS